MADLRDFFDSVVVFETELWNLTEQIHREAGSDLSLARVSVLRTIAAGAGMARVQDVVVNHRITVSAASRFVDRLEVDGLVVRATHPTDRRSSVLDLTDAARQALATSERALDQALEQLLGAEDRKDLAALRAAVVAIHSRMLQRRPSD